MIQLYRRISKIGTYNRFCAREERAGIVNGVHRLLRLYQPRSKNSSMSFDRCPEMSIPISSIVTTASGFTSRTSVPALPTSNQSPYRAQSYRHLGSGRIVGTDEQNTGFSFHLINFLVTSVLSNFFTVILCHFLFSLRRSLRFSG